MVARFALRVRTLFADRLGDASVGLKVAGYMLGSAVCFSITTAIIRHISADLAPLEIAFFRSLFGVLVLAPWLWHHGFSALRTEHIGLHILRGVVGGVAMLAWFYALSVIPLAKAVALSFTTPLLATIAAVVILGELIRLRRWTATVVGFIGTMIILRPGTEALDFGAILVLLSAVALAVNVVLVKILSRKETSTAIVAHFGIFMVPVTLVPALFVWRWPTAPELAWMILVGAFATLSHLCRARALALADVSAVVQYDFTRLPIIALVGYFLFSEVPDGWTWVGAAVIIASTVYVTHREIQVRRQRGGKTESGVATEASLSPDRE